MQSSCREAIICADWVRRRIKATALITTVCSQLQLFVALAQKKGPRPSSDRGPAMSRPK
jgi:hypothetical protein